MIENSFQILSKLSVHSIFAVIVGGVVVASIPISLFLINQRQDVKQRAAGSDYSCLPHDGGQINHCRPKGLCESFEQNVDGAGGTNQSCMDLLYPDGSNEATCCKLLPQSSYPTSSTGCPTVDPQGYVNYCLPNSCSGGMTSVPGGNEACRNYLYNGTKNAYCCKSTYKAISTPTNNPTSPLVPTQVPTIIIPTPTTSFANPTTPPVGGVNPTPTSVQFPSGFSVSGRAYIDIDDSNNFNSGDVILNNQIVKLSNGSQARTNPQGRYSISGITSGDYILTLVFDKQGNNAEIAKNLTISSDLIYDFSLKVSLSVN